MVDGSTPDVACEAAQLFEARQCQGFKFCGMAGGFAHFVTNPQHSVRANIPGLFRDSQQAVAFSAASAASLAGSAAAAKQLASKLQDNKHLSIVLPYPIISLHSLTTVAMGSSGVRAPRLVAQLSQLSADHAFRQDSSAGLPMLPACTQLSGVRSRKRHRGLTSKRLSATTQSQSVTPRPGDTAHPPPAKLARFLLSKLGGRALTAAIVKTTANVASSGVAAGPPLAVQEQWPVLLYVDVCGPAPWKQLQAVHDEHGAAAAEQASQSKWEDRWLLLDAVRFARLLPQMAQPSRLLVWQPRLYTRHSQLHQRSAIRGLDRLPLKLASALVACHRNQPTDDFSRSARVTTSQLAGMWLASTGSVWGSVTRSYTANIQWWQRQLVALCSDGDKAVNSVELSTVTAAELSSTRTDASGSILVRYAVDLQAGAASTTLAKKFRSAVLPASHVQHAARRAIMAIIATQSARVLVCSE